MVSDEVKRRIKAFVEGATPGLIWGMFNRAVRSEEIQVTKDLAEDYGEIAERMRKEKRGIREEAPPAKAPTTESLTACYRCSLEHLGEVLSALDHASGRERGSEEYEQKIMRAMDKLLEVEREHLGPKDPENARRIRSIRKLVESHIGPGEPEEPLSGIVERIKEIRPKMKELWHEASEKEPEVLEEAEQQVISSLESFEDTLDVKHLKSAAKHARETGCDACTAYIRAAIDAMEEGREDEAREWVRGVRRGIRAASS